MTFFEQKTANKYVNIPKKIAKREGSKIIANGIRNLKL